MNFRSFAVLVSALSTLGLGLSACKSTATGGAGGSGGGTGTTASSTGTGKATTSTTTGTGTTTSATTTTTGTTTSSTGTGTGGAGGAAACQKCSEAITPPNGDPAKICAGESTMKFDALKACACTDMCMTECGDNKCMGKAPSDMCNTCVPAKCTAELTACSNDL